MQQWRRGEPCNYTSDLGATDREVPRVQRTNAEVAERKAKAAINAKRNTHAKQGFDTDSIESSLVGNTDIFFLEGESSNDEEAVSILTEQCHSKEALFAIENQKQYDTDSKSQESRTTVLQNSGIVKTNAQTNSLQYSPAHTYIIEQ